MMRYGLEFLFIALVLLLLLFYHYMTQNQVNDTKNKIFLFFLVVGIFDIFFDIASTVLISGDFPEQAQLAKGILTLFYILQVLFPASMLWYVVSLRDTSQEKLHKTLRIYMVPPIIMLLIVGVNIFSGTLFYFDAEGMYWRGSWYFLTYYHALYCGGVMLFGSLIHIDELSKENLKAICEYLVIEVACVVVQASTGLLTTGLGISLGILVLYLTINNPSAYTDNLTGVFDKKYFHKWMQEQSVKNHSYNLLAIELSQLKRVNATLGTKMGDELLLQVSDHIQEICVSGLVFRTEGNQFVLVSDNLKDYESQRDALRDYFDSLFVASGETICFPAIICGIINAGEIQKKGDDLEGYLEYLVSLAPLTNELIMLQGNEQTLEGFRYEQEIERYLNTAIEQDLFTIVYQPVYSLEKESFVTLEALSRLSHPSLGPVSPQVFISIAERTGRIAEIGLLQFRRICAFVKSHPELLDELQNIKFNLSPMELLKNGHCNSLVKIIKEYELSPTFFQFEITETVATQYSENLFQVIRELEQAGIGLCLDDFGSGFANLNTVLQLPFSVVKLDRSLLLGINQEDRCAAFYENIVAILRKMGFTIVSEGVETQEEVQKLSAWGVNYIQGYYFSRPLPEKEILKMIAHKE